MTSALDGGGWSLSRPVLLYAWERPGTHCTGSWVGPRAGLDGCGKCRPPPGFDPQNVQPVTSRYTVYVIPARRCGMVPCYFGTWRCFKGITSRCFWDNAIVSKLGYQSPSDPASRRTRTKNVTALLRDLKIPQMWCPYAGVLKRMCY